MGTAAVMVIPSIPCGRAGALSARVMDSEPWSSDVDPRDGDALRAQPCAGAVAATLPQSRRVCSRAGPPLVVEHGGGNDPNDQERVQRGQGVTGRNGDALFGELFAPHLAFGQQLPDGEPGIANQDGGDDG